MKISRMMIKIYHFNSKNMISNWGRVYTFDKCVMYRHATDSVIKRFIGFVLLAAGAAETDGEELLES